MAEKVKRISARQLYVKDKLPLSVIAKRLKVSERAVSRWKSADAAAGDDWNKARMSAQLSKTNVEASTQQYLEAFLPYHIEVFEELKNNTDMTTAEKVAAITSLADAYTKTVKACSITAPALSHLAIAGDVLQKLAAFVAKNHPDAAPVLLSVLDPFAQELSRIYG